ncbi:MAG: FkbM family methyltransferase [Gammaproteobacteria bacterium]|nr:FkbM family methyltransferase [Gammaproteobacteria bacterium]
MMEIPLPPVSRTDAERILMTSKCRDCGDLPKVPGAGGVFSDAGRLWQRMFNGIEVLYGGYYGEWMAELIRQLDGHHEPQEERVFYEIVKRVRPAGAMIELGCYWGYYSLWFAREVANPTLVMCEPDPEHLKIAAINLERNGVEAALLPYAAGKDSGEIVLRIESSGQSKAVGVRSVKDLLDDHGLDFLDILHLDTQGAETDVVDSLAELDVKERLRFVIVSTHHHTISGDPLTHERCLHRLRQMGAHIIAEHTVDESFSGDGLIAVSFQHCDRNLVVGLSYNRASGSLFRPLNFDLAVLSE